MKKIAELRLLDPNLTTVHGILPYQKADLFLHLNEPGSGAVETALDITSADLVESGGFVDVRYRGENRGGFFVENPSKAEANTQEEEGRSLSVSGRGALALLEDGIVWTDGSGANTRTFNDTQAGMLITLIDEVQLRGGLLNLSCDFTNFYDSNGVAWTDNFPLEMTVGTSLLDVARQIAKTGIDFDIQPDGSGNFVLRAYKDGLGSDKSQTIFFRVGVNCQEVSSDEAGGDIRNALLVKYKNGYTTALDSTSITNRRRRERSVNYEHAQSSASAATLASAELELKKDPRKQISLQIYDGKGPRVFEDYVLGDTITLDKKGVRESYRIRGIHLSWTGNDFADVIVDLNSMILENEIRITQDVDWLTNMWKTAHDAGLLEVSFWASIGEPSIEYHTVFTGLIGDKLYLVQSSSGGNRIYEYDITMGTWKVFRDIVGLSQFNRCACIVGTDIYIGGLFVIYKFDTLTETLSTLTSTWDSGNPLSSNTLIAVAVGTKIYFDGNWTSIGTLSNPVGVAEYDTIAGTWADIDNGASGHPLKIKSDGTHLYMVYLDELWKYSGSWTQLGSFPVDADDISSNVVEYGSGIIVAAGATVYYWDGAAWSTLVTLSDSVSALAVCLTDVYMSGAFTSEGSHITRYSGGSFWALEEGINSGAKILLYQSNDNVDVFISGDLVTTAGGKPANVVAAYYNNFEALSDYLEHPNSTFNLAEAIHNATSKSSMSGADELGFWDSISSRLRKITWTNILASIKTTTDGWYVALVGNQTIAGIKIFLSFPVTPSSAPSTDYEVANKKYVDDNAGGGGGTWGGIVGTLSDQADLQSELDDKLDIHGHTSNRIPFTDAIGDIVTDDQLIYDVVANFLGIGNLEIDSFQNASLGGNSGDTPAASPENSSGSLLVTFRAASSLPGSFIKGLYVRGTKLLPTAVMSGDVFLRLRGGGFDGTGTIRDNITSGEIKVVASENFDGTHHGTDVEVYATPAGSTVLTKILSILGSGHVNIESGKEYQVNGVEVVAAKLAGTIHSATENTSLTSNDEFGIWGSVSGLLRKIKWSTLISELSAYFVSHSSSTAANDFLVGSGTGAWIKKSLAQTITILRSSLDSVYAALSHTHAAGDITSGTFDAARLPAPTTTALGGVKRNTGSAGQYVTGIDSGGALTYDTPAGGGGITVSAQSITTSNLTGSEDYFYILDISGLTANRDFILPTPSAAGKRIKLRINIGDNVYSLLIKVNSVEITRLFISGEMLEFTSTGTGAANWVVSHDGRIPTHGIMERRTAQSIAGGSYPVKVQLATKVKDIGEVCDNATNYRMTMRRAANYEIIGVIIFNNVFPDQKNIQSIIHVNNAFDTFQITYTSHASGAADQPGMARVIYEKSLAIGDYVELIGFHNLAGSTNTGTTVGYPQLSVKEILPPI